MTQTRHKQRSGQNLIWIIPVILIVILGLGVGGYLAYTFYQQTQSQNELTAMRQNLDKNVFYSGIYIDDLDLSGKSYDEIKTELKKRNDAWQSSFKYTLKFGSQSWNLTATDAGMTSDWQAVLDNAWQTGRVSSLDLENEQIRERYAVVEALKTNPLHLKISQKYDESKISSAVLSIVDSLQIKPAGAIATSFDLAAKKFIIKEQKPGRTLNSEAIVKEVLGLLVKGQMGATITLQAETSTVGMTRATMLSHLGLVSKAVTYANAVNINRDSNIRLICKLLNGVVIQPGETFSFNRQIGERTAAKGFLTAGGIKEGVLIEELGGGICQPNTTLCQAVLMADLEIVERHPHSWPSTYVPVGLDATVSWNGPDFKFRNDTAYPVAIVCWYTKPAINFQIYGRVLDPGVTIALEAVHDGFIPVAEPQETLNPELKPGARLEIRAPHIGQRATAYKVWEKDNKVIRREEIFKSYYRPIQGIYQFGPPVTASTTASTEATTAATTEATTSPTTTDY